MSIPSFRTDLRQTCANETCVVNQLYTQINIHIYKIWKWTRQPDSVQRMALCANSNRPCQSVSAARHLFATCTQLRDRAREPTQHLAYNRIRCISRSSRWHIYRNLRVAFIYINIDSPNIMSKYILVHQRVSLVFCVCDTCDVWVCCCHKIFTKRNSSSKRFFVDADDQN